jgi:cytochrome P450
VDPGIWLVTAPAAIEHLLASENVSTDRAESRTTVTAWGPDGLGRWMAARRVMRPVLTASHAASFIPSMTRMARRVLSGWAGRADIEAMAEAEALISAVNIGYMLGEHSGQVPSLVAHELDVAERSHGGFFRGRRLLRAQRTTYAAIRGHIRSHDTARGGHGLVDVLAEAGFDEHAVVLALRSMLLAGFRVPAAALAWILHELAAHPAVQDEARREAAALAEDAMSIDRLSYCQAVARETLRLHPPVWQFRRRLTARAATLPANDSVLFSAYVSQRDERVYADPDEFRPERWLDPGFRPRLGSYFPFGAGPRFCPGAPLAVVELAVLTATVLTSYHVTIRQRAAPCGGMLHAPYGAHLGVTPTQSRGPRALQ